MDYRCVLLGLYSVSKDFKISFQYVKIRRIHIRDPANWLRKESGDQVCTVSQGFVRLGLSCVWLPMQAGLGSPGQHRPHLDS